MQVAVCANLPYYITSPVIMRLLEQRLPIRSITVMVQKEAAQRLCARPGTREAGAVSIAVRTGWDPCPYEQAVRLGLGNAKPARKAVQQCLAESPATS